MTEAARELRVKHLQQLTAIRRGEASYNDSRIFCWHCSGSRRCQLGVELRTGGSGIAGSVTFGDWAEGGGGIVHGGMILAAFDELLTAVHMSTGILAVTLRLQGEFHYPVPVGAALQLTGWSEARPGDQLGAAGTMQLGSRVMASAAGDFRARDPERHFRWATAQDSRDNERYPEPRSGRRPRNRDTWMRAQSPRGSTIGRPWSRAAQPASRERRSETAIWESPFITATACVRTIVRNSGPDLS